MLELKFIRNNPDVVRADLTKRGGDDEKLAWIDDLLEKDIQSRDMQIDINTMRNRRNIISREIKEAKKQNRISQDFLKRQNPCLLKSGKRKPHSKR